MQTIDLPDILPVQVLYDPLDNILYVTYFGELAPGKITQVSKHIANCEFFSRDLPTLIDYSQSSIKTDVDATLGFLEYLKSMIDQLGKPKWAIISGSELNSAMLRRLIFLMEDLPIIIKEFKSNAEALEWLKT